MTSLSLSFQPLVPWVLIAAFGLAAVALVVAGLLARRRGSLVRAAALGLVLFALTDPSLVRENRDPLKDVVAVVIDQSGSQSIGERTAQTERVRAELEKSLAALGNVEPRFIESGRTDAENDGTRLFAALNAGLADVPPERVAGAILVTDGVVHDIPPSPEALGFKAPLHALITGHEGERDRRVELVEAPRFGIVGKDLTVTLRVLDTGSGGEPVNIEVRRDGAPVATLSAAIGEPIKVPIRIDHAGPNVIEIAVAPIPGELTTINNKAVLTVEGVRDKLRVLLVSGEPHAGERTWRNLLKSDPNVDLVHFTILRPVDKLDATPINELALIAFPVRDLFGPKISEFDLIIFDRYANQSVLPSFYLDAIVRYVRDGGALLIAAGPDFSGPDGLYYTPLGNISPARPDGNVIEQPFRAAVTDDGRKHPVTRGLGGSDSNPPAWSEWFRQISAEVAKGTAIMSGADGRPLLVLAREGKGRVGLLLSDQMWLWARGFRGGGPHLDLLRRLAHWLMKEPDLEEEALRANVRGRQITIERQSLKEETDRVTVTAPSGAAEIVDLTRAGPGLARATYTAREIGLYRMNDGTLSALANVGPENPKEFQDVISTTEKLRPLAEATGGTVRRVSAGGDNVIVPRLVAMRAAPVYGGSDFIAIKRTDASVVRGVAVVPLGTGLIALLVLLGAIVLAWAYEGFRRSSRIPTA
ncbi:MAG: hypothetical protein JO163_08225 [Methylobacteriaceae bacterium]|nr:hypothetical protein [Methylobacteriaceae bacterium]